MTTPVYNVDAVRGSTITVPVAIQDSDGTVADLIGYTGDMQVRASADAAEVLVEGDVTVDVVNGLVTGVLSADDLFDAGWNAAVYDIRITGATTEYVASGTIRLRPAVTR